MLEFFKRLHHLLFCNKIKAFQVTGLIQCKKTFQRFQIVSQAETRDINIECSKQLKKKLILSYAWAEPAVLGSTKTTLKFKDEI